MIRAPPKTHTFKSIYMNYINYALYFIWLVNRPFIEHHWALKYSRGDFSHFISYDILEYFMNQAMKIKVIWFSILFIAWAVLQWYSMSVVRGLERSAILLSLWSNKSLCGFSGSDNAMTTTNHPKTKICVQQLLYAGERMNIVPFSCTRDRYKFE